MSLHACDTRAKTHRNWVSKSAMFLSLSGRQSPLMSRLPRRFPITLMKLGFGRPSLALNVAEFGEMTPLAKKAPR